MNNLICWEKALDLHAVICLDQRLQGAQLGLMASGSSPPPPPPPRLGYLGQVGYHNQPGPNVHGEVSFVFMLCITVSELYTSLEVGSVDL